MVDKFPPLPSMDGGKLRSAALLRRLAALGDVVVCCFEGEPGDRVAYRALGVDLRTVPWRPSALPVLRGLARTRSLSAARFWSDDLAATVRSAVREAPTDVLLVEHGQLGRYLECGSAGLSVLDMHNVDSVLASSYTNGSGPRAALAAVEARLLRGLERTVLATADVTLTVSRGDADLVRPWARELLVCPNGWDCQEPLPPAARPIVVFTALMSWAPNVDAAVWFAERVWPRVHSEVPGSELWLVGKDPTPAVRSLADAPGVVVTGTVPEIRPYLADARVAVAPLRSGGGTRLKVLEALDAGRPVVGTTVGLSGLEELDGRGLQTADSPDEMAGAVRAWLLDPGAAAEAGMDGHRAVTEAYGWDRCLAPFFARIAC